MRIFLLYSRMKDAFLSRFRIFSACHSFPLWPGLRFTGLGVLALLSGCATYQPHPLPEQVEYQGRIREINMADGLDLSDVAVLAVEGNPDLRAKRQGLGIARAQVFAAGLLPDPQLSLSLDHPTGSTAGVVNATGIGIAYDIIPLITRQARIDVGRGMQKKVQLNLLWQEWQVIQQARTLAVRTRFEQEKLTLLRTMQGLYRTRYQRSRQGVQDGNVTVDINGTDLSVLMDSSSQIYQLEKIHNKTRHALRLLLGVPPDAKININALPAGPRYEKAVINAQLDRLAEVRPDLLALKAGYQAQESRVRAAILAQFPAFSFGFSNARDTGNIRTNGLNIGLTILLFSGNRGAIAIERATRAQLFQEYQARLAQANIEVDQLLDFQEIVRRQQKTLMSNLPELQAIVIHARKAYGQGNIDALTFLNMESTLINKRLEKLSLEQRQWQIKIALQTLLALPEK